MKEKVLVTWTTEDEIRYLKTIGENTKQFTNIKNRLSAAGKTKIKKAFLKRALTTYEKRANWGDINRDKVLDFATTELSRL